jgi:uncharacterized membrane protein YphA (DoxX/SURF4 family)
MPNQSQMKINKSLPVFVISYLFILLFIYAAASKLMDYDKFKIQVGQSPLLTNYAGVIAWFIPALEIVIAVLLTVKRTVLLGLYASLSLMVMFTVYIILILNFAERVPCSCGGILERMSWTTHLVFNIVFVALALAGILLGSEKKQRLNNP